MSSNVLVVGLGAVGAISAYAAQKSGIANVTVVARSNYEIVKEHGIDIKSDHHGEHLGWRPNRLCKSIAEAADREYAYVIVVTKCLPEVLKTSTLLEPLLNVAYTERFKQPVYVLVQNGLGIEIDLYETLKSRGEAPRIVSVAMFILAKQLGPNIFQSGAQERYVSGVYRPNDFTTTENSEDERRTLDGFSAIMTKGGSAVEIVPEIQRRKYEKNITNVVLAGVNLLTRYPLTTIFRPPPTGDEDYEFHYFPGTQALFEEFTIPMLRNMVKELILLARALGFPNSPDGLQDSAEDELIQFARDNYSLPSSFHVGSTLIDLQKDSPMEIEVIWGSVVRLAKARGISMPRVEMVYGLVLVMQNQILRKKMKI